MFTVKQFIMLVLIAAAVCPACKSAPKESQAPQPEWVSDPYKVYNRTVYLAAVGYGSSRDTAEKNALLNLTSIFGQSVSGESSVNYTYSQALEASSSVWSEKSDLAQAVRTSVAMDTLIGAEIKDVYRNSGGTWYALALMDRAKTQLIYSELINQNQNTITQLVSLSADKKVTIDGFINYYQAASLADANLVFANVVNVISPPFNAGEGLKTGNDFRLEAAQIARNIPIAVIVDNDRQGRLTSAFSAILAKAGFRIGPVNSRFALRADIFMEEIAYQGNPYKWVRYIMNSYLTDTASGTVLFPFAIEGREGSTNITEAEIRAVRSAENKLSADYLNALSMFFSRNIKK